MIGIFGGTFDPIHYGHLRPALDVKEALDLGRVLFVPLRQAVHRGQPWASSEQRLAMVRAAVSDEKGFDIDEVELDRDGPSYMVDTLHALHERYPDQTICLLLGGDAFNDFLSWHRPQEIASLCHIVVMKRPGYLFPEEPQLKEFVDQRKVDSVKMLRCASSNSVFFQNVTQLDISATDIRNRVADGKSLRYLLPDSVIEIIRQQRLYGC